MRRADAHSGIRTPTHRVPGDQRPVHSDGGDPETSRPRHRTAYPKPATRTVQCTYEPLFIAGRVEGDVLQRAREVVVKSKLWQGDCVMSMAGGTGSGFSKTAT